MTTRLRELRPEDIGDCLDLSNAAGWNQTAADWARTLALPGGVCLGIEADGRIVAAGTDIRYGRHLAWIGMMLTHPGHRRRGYARRVLSALLARLDEDGISCVKLDGTEAGQPLYEQFGFVAEEPAERWKRPASPATPGFEPHPAFRYDPALDRAAFGADRSDLIQILSTCGWGASLPSGSFALARPGALATYFGPCVCRAPEEARTLLTWFLARHSDRDVFWDLLPANADAPRLAEANGFTPARRLARMVRRLPGGTAGTAPDDRLVFAIAGFEFG